MHSHETGWPASVRADTSAQVWIVAVLGFVVGDVATTSFGLGLVGVREANPVMATLFQESLPVILAVKLGFVGGSVVLWRYTPRPHRLGIPLALAVVGVTVTAWNLLVIARATVF
jgi:hypothetical protein